LEKVEICGYQTSDCWYDLAKLLHWGAVEVTSNFQLGEFH